MRREGLLLIWGLGIAFLGSFSLSAQRLPAPPNSPDPFLGPEIEGPYRAEIAITFDDGPTPDSVLYRALERTALIIQQLEEEQVPQVGFFVNGRNHDGEISDLQLSLVSEAGHILGNHGFSHLRMSDVLIDDYIRDIELNHRFLQGRRGFLNLFRFPFQGESVTPIYKNEVQSTLSELGYKHAYVTIDSWDWYLNHVVQTHLERGGEVRFDRLKQIYIDLLVDSIEFYDELALKVLQRPTRHVLRLHENDLAARYLSDFLQALKSRGWIFISLEEAYKDRISTEFVENSDGLQGRIAQLARERGFEGLLKHPAETHERIDAILLEQDVLIPLDYD